MDDAADDDTIHAFVLHSQGPASTMAPAAAARPRTAGGSADAGAAAGATAAAPKAGKAVAALALSSTSTSTSGPGLGSPCSRLLRPSDLKRCLRFLCESDLWAAAAAAKGMRKAAADPRLWRAVGRLEVPPALRAKAKPKA